MKTVSRMKTGVRVKSTRCAISCKKRMLENKAGKGRKLQEKRDEEVRDVATTARLGAAATMMTAAVAPLPAVAAVNEVAAVAGDNRALFLLGLFVRVSFSLARALPHKHTNLESNAHTPRQKEMNRIKSKTYLRITRNTNAL